MTIRDISSEKLNWVVSEIIDGEFSSQLAILIWCRWRRERERLTQMLREKQIPVHEIFGGQSQKQRDSAIESFQLDTPARRILIAQQHSGGFGLNLTAASVAIFLSNDFSYTARIQAEDRMHRIGQNNNCLYLDILAVGPNSQRTVDHAVLEALREKRSLADFTCKQWKRVLE